MRRRITHASALAALLVFLCSSASAQTTKPQEFPFAVGAGGFSVNDTGRSTETFSTGGFHAFFEVALDPGVLLQARYERFQLPGSASSSPFQPAALAPRIQVDAGNVTVGYVFREAWWEAGLFAGIGLYGLRPRPPEAGQTAVDVRETVFGWNGGTLLVFQLARRWDLRVEAAGYLLRANRSDDSLKLLQLGGSVAYHF
jgi:hypothetical protein